MKKQIHDEKEILDFVAKHTFEDRKNNLEAVKMRLGLDDVKQKRLKARFQYARICYMLSCISLVLSIGTFGVARLFVNLTVSQPQFISEQMSANIYRSFQSKQVVWGMTAAIVFLLTLSVLFGGLGFYLKKTMKEFK